MATLNEREATERCGEFLGEIVNNPDISPVRLVELWDTERSTYASLVARLQHDLSLIERILMLYDQLSAAGQEEQTARPLQNTRSGIESALEGIGEIVGKLTPHRASRFDFIRDLTRTVVYLQKAGLKRRQATLVAAACAVHLGRVDIQEPPLRLKLSAGTGILRLPEETSNGLFDRVWKACSRYLARSREVCSHTPASSSTPLGADDGAPWPPRFRVKQDYARQERSEFAEFWAESEARSETNIRGKLRASHRRYRRLKDSQPNTSDGEQDKK
jgi:hypothetical protein